MKLESWSVVRSWAALRQAARETLVADEVDRARVVGLLRLESLDSLHATLTYEPWFDGAKISGLVVGDAGRLCGVTLESLDERVETEFTARVVPPGSPHAPKAEAELIVSLDDDDPPDVVSGDEIDVAGYVVEALALALNPFPRKPGAIFQPVEGNPNLSPFAVLLRKGGVD